MYIKIPWNCTVFHYEITAHKCCSPAPLSGSLIWDKNQSSTLENSISVMRYAYSSKHKSEIVRCFQTSPLKAIWCLAANYKAFWTASLPSLDSTCPLAAAFSVYHIPSIIALLLRCWELTSASVMRGRYCFGIFLRDVFECYCCKISSILTWLISCWTHFSMFIFLTVAWLKALTPMSGWGRAEQSLMTDKHVYITSIICQTKNCLEHCRVM